MSGQRILGMLLFLAGLVGLFVVLMAWMVGGIRDFQFWRLIWAPVGMMGFGILAIRSGDREDDFSRESYRSPPPRPATPAPQPPPLRAFPVVTGGPGQYHVCGVDRASGMDTEWRVQAASVENARVKAELEGIVVTSVSFEGR